MWRAARILLALLLAPLCYCQVLNLGPSSSIFVPTQVVGNNASGTLVSLYGCNGDGATLSSFTLYANSEYIRGMSANLTDGQSVLYGCVNVTANGTGNGGCNDTDIRSATFNFQTGERVTNMTLWPGYSPQKQPNQRAGAVNFQTSLGSVFDFGMNDTRINPVAINLGSGIPCGVNPRAGADIDALGFVFLRNVTSSVLTNVQYEGVLQQQQAVNLSNMPVDIEGNSSLIVLANQTYNNSVQTTNLTATFASGEPTTTTAFWSSDYGLDSYLTSMVSAAIPIASNGSADLSSSWGVSASTLHNRSESNTTMITWNYTVNLNPGGVTQVAATAVQSSLTTNYTANLNITLDSQYVLSIPIQGYFDGEATSAVSIQANQIKAGSQPPAPSPAGGHSNTLAWVLGTIFGVLGGLLFAALLAWAIIAFMKRRRNAQAQTSQNTPPPSAFIVPGLGKEARSSTDGKGGKDIEMGPAAAGSKAGRKEGWEPETKASTVMGVPVHRDQGSATSDGRTVMSYDMFRRLRLESIRHALGRGREQSSSAGPPESPAQTGEMYPTPHNTPEGLSNPPSVPSTPRSVYHPTVRATANQPGDSPTATPRSQISEEDQKSEAGHEDERTPVPLAIRSPSPRKTAVGGLQAERSSRMKDRVAAIRAERKGNTSPRSGPVPSPSADPDARPASNMQASAALLPDIRPSSRMEKGKAMLNKLATSISGISAMRSPRSTIRHDNTDIDLMGRPRVASPATPVQFPLTTPLASDSQESTSPSLDPPTPPQSSPATAPKKTGNKQT